MRRSVLTLLATLCLTGAAAQKIEYTTNEECGCELVVVDGIETTQSGGLYGFRLLDGTVIAENQYKYVDRFHDGYCRVYVDDEHCGLIDRTGREVLPCVFEKINYPSDGRILAVKDLKVGFYDLEGNLAVPHQYLKATDYSDSTAVVAIEVDGEERYTFIDTAGRRLMAATYPLAMPFREGYAEVYDGKLWGMIDKRGREVLPMKYMYMSLNEKGHFFAGDTNGLAMFDYTMRPVTDFVYFDPGTTYENRTSVSRDGKFGFLDEKGNEAVPCIYDEVGLFRQGRTQVRIGKKYGIVDTTGRIVLPIEYDNTYRKAYKYMYYEGLAMVEKDGRTGYVDLEGKLVIPMLFERGYQFTQGLAAVKHNGMWGYIDTKGEVYMPFVFDVASPYHWGRAEVVFNGNTSKVDLTGRCVKNCNGVIAWREIFK